MAGRRLGFCTRAGGFPFRPPRSHAPRLQKNRKKLPWHPHCAPPTTSAALPSRTCPTPTNKKPRQGREELSSHAVPPPVVTTTPGGLHKSFLFGPSFGDGYRHSLDSLSPRNASPLALGTACAMWADGQANSARNRRTGPLSPCA